MRLAIIGSRGFDNYDLMKQTLKQVLQGHVIDCVISGGAAGADSLAEFWAKEHGIPVQVFKADWNTHGKSAGFLRNSNIVNRADTIVAFWDQISHGTADTIKKARQANKEVLVINYIPRRPEII